MADMLAATLHAKTGAEQMRQDQRVSASLGRAGIAGGKRHAGHPGPKPEQVYRVQSW
jgi:hypothetical protein